MGQLHDAWKEVQMTSPASTGDPAVWLDFKPPFAEAPPVLLPHKPDPGPEPELQPAADLQDLPVLQLPVPQVNTDFSCVCTGFAASSCHRALTLNGVFVKYALRDTSGTMLCTIVIQT